MITQSLKNGSNLAYLKGTVKPFSAEPLLDIDCVES